MPLTDTRTPVMTHHVSSTHHRRRRPARPAIVAAVTLLFASTVASADAPIIDDSATVQSTAERLMVDDPGIPFPIEPTPVCEVLNNFGGRSKTYGSGGHRGLDIGATEEQAVYAVEAGVLYRQWDDLGDAPGLAWGLWSVTDTKYRYFHLSRFAEGLEVGDEVEAGELIGYVGDTGNASPGGWHLHFEIQPGPTYDSVDPVPLLNIPSSCNVY